MDGLASLAAAANLVELQSSSNIGSPLKRKTSFKSSTSNIINHATNSPKKKKKLEENDREYISKEYHAAKSEVPRPETIDPAFVERVSLPLSTNLRLRCIHEFFYPTLDRDYFDENEFISCLQQLGLHQYTSLTRAQWSYVRCVLGSQIGRPRRFSPAFLASEREKLQRYRQSVRALQFGYNTVPFRDFPYQIYDPVDVGDCVTVYHVPTSSLQRGLVLSLHSYSPNSVEYLIQYDSLELGHGVVSDELIAIHGEVPLRYQKKRFYDIVRDSIPQNLAWSMNFEEGGIPLSLDPLNLPPPFHLNSSPSSTRQILEELWRKCVDDSSTLLEELLASSSMSLPPPPDLSSLSSTSYSTVPSGGKSLFLLSSSDTKHDSDSNPNQEIDDDTIEELLHPLVASLFFLQHSLFNDQFLPSSISLDKTFINEMNHFLMEKIQQIYPPTSTLTSLSQLYDSLLKVLLPKSPGASSSFISSLQQQPARASTGYILNRPIQRSSGSSSGPLRSNSPNSDS